jgi:hypothetical protein
VASRDHLDLAFLVPVIVDVRHFCVGNQAAALLKDPTLPSALITVLNSKALDRPSFPRLTVRVLK